MRVRLCERLSLWVPIKHQQTGSDFRNRAPRISTNFGSRMRWSQVGHVRSTLLWDTLVFCEYSLHRKTAINEIFDQFLALPLSGSGTSLSRQKSTVQPPKPRCLFGLERLKQGKPGRFKRLICSSSFIRHSCWSWFSFSLEAKHAIWGHGWNEQRPSMVKEGGQCQEAGA